MSEKSPRVNSVHIGKYIGQTVWATAQVVRIEGNTAIVKLADGGQIEVFWRDESNLKDSFVEIVGKVETPTRLEMFKAINMGDKMDMEVVNHTIELMHTPAMASLWGTTP